MSILQITKRVSQKTLKNALIDFKKTLHKWGMTSDGCKAVKRVLEQCPIYKIDTGTVFTMNGSSDNKVPTSYRRPSKLPRRFDTDKEVR